MSSNPIPCPTNGIAIDKCVKPSRGCWKGGLVAVDGGRTPRRRY